MFWGLFFLIIGLLILVQHLFHIDLPVVKILFGCLLIYWGLKVIFGSFGFHMSGFHPERIVTDTELAFTDGEFATRRSEDNKLHRKFDGAFSNSMLDLSNLTDEELKDEFEINNAFGKMIIKTPAGVPIKAEINIGFGAIRIRGQKLGNFGEIEYKSEGYKPDSKVLKLRIDCGFGNVVVE